MFGVEVLLAAGVFAALGAIDTYRAGRRQDRACVQAAYEERMRYESAVIQLHQEIARAEHEIYQAELDDWQARHPHTPITSFPTGHELR